MDLKLSQPEGVLYVAVPATMLVVVETSSSQPTSLSSAMSDHSSRATRLATVAISALLNAVGNGITITDDSGGAGPLSVKTDAVSTALGIAGEVVTPGDPLVGEDVNPLEATGVLNILIGLENALETGDDRQLNRLAGLIDEEANRLNLVRGEVGSRLQLLEQVENRLLDEEIVLQESLSEEFHIDLAEAITQLANKQATLEATLQAAASTLQMSLFSFL